MIPEWFLKPRSVVIKSPERTQDSQKQTLSNIFPTKNASQLIPITHDEMKRWEILKTPWVFRTCRFYGETVHALFLMDQLKVETAHCNLRCFACWRKTPPNKWRAAKPYEMVMNWAQEREKQAKINPSLRKWNQFISIFMPVLLRFNNYIGFFHASLAINRSYYAKQYQNTR